MLPSLNAQVLESKQQSTCNLKNVLSYKNKKLIFKFCETYRVTIEEAEEIFNETKKFLYLCAKNQTTNIAIYESMLIIDEMWHMFILFTQDYHDFCIKYFGYYMHHSPETKKNRISLKNINIFKKQLVAVVKTLDKETLLKWYNEYAEKYSHDNLNKLRIPLKINKQKNKKLPIITSDILLSKDINYIANLMWTTTTCGDGTKCMPKV